MEFFEAAELVCTDRDMQLHILLEKPLQHPARIFVKEQSANPRCVHHYEEQSDHNALMFRIPLSTCGMQRVQQHTNRFSFTTSVVVSFHKFFVSSHDKTFRISCDYAQARQPPKQDVTAGIGVDVCRENSCRLADGKVFTIPPDCSKRSSRAVRQASNSSIELSEVVRVEESLTSDSIDFDKSLRNPVCLSPLIQLALAVATFILFCSSVGMVFCCRKPERLQCHCTPSRIF
ncbi:hypothetical protein FO519_004530 [Halicephalobus sp. NKZ332]|nr:hypothetical protein FO519_004530 [Halicephalobus sp. NKZ332]